MSCVCSAYSSSKHLFSSCPEREFIGIFFLEEFGALLRMQIAPLEQNVIGHLICLFVGALVEYLEKSSLSGPC